MQHIRGKYVPPAINKTAFNCPHCGALAKQFWFSMHAEPMKKDNTSLIAHPESGKEQSFDRIQGPEDRQKFFELVDQMATGRPFVWRNHEYIQYNLENVFLSRCFNCKEVSIWICDRLVWPQRGEAPLPNPDLPDDVRGDYEEAGRILDLSPRGAAALLRLGIQKLCKHLGEKGKNIDDDIAALVKKGLDGRVQQALDVVRVIGNNAVHPGQIDLSDDRATAENLFRLVNLIAEKMISEPMHVGEMFNSLPEGVLKAIEKRDGQKGSGD